MASFLGDRREDLRWSAHEKRFFWSLTGAMLFVTLIAGSTHDYSFYRVQWEAIANGHNPWATEVDGVSVPVNAYGPLHAVLAPLEPICWMLPKLVFAGMVMAVYAALIDASKRAGLTNDRARLVYLAALFPLMPAVLIPVFGFGNNDIFPALCMALACVVLARGARTGAGVWIGLGALMKFYPLIFAGFLAGRRDGRLDLRVLLVALALFVLGMGISYLVWGPAVFSPFQFGHERVPKILSPLRFAVSVETLRESAVIEHLIARNTIYVLAAAVLVGLHGWLARLDRDITLMMGILTVLLAYKIGHPQFYVSWLAVWAWVLASRNEGAAWRVAQGFWPVALFLSAYQTLYLLSKWISGDGYLGGDWHFIRYYVSLFFAPTVLWCVIRVRKDLFQRWQRPAGVRF